MKNHPVKIIPNESIKATPDKQKLASQIIQPNSEKPL